MKEKEIYPNEDETPKLEEIEQVVIVKLVFVMTINTSQPSNPTNNGYSINTTKLNAKEANSNNLVGKSTEKYYDTYFFFNINNPNRKIKLGKLAPGNHRKKI